MQTCVIVITFEPAYVRRQVVNMSGGGLPLCVYARGALRGLICSESAEATVEMCGDTCACRICAGGRVDIGEEMCA